MFHVVRWGWFCGLCLFGGPPGRRWLTRFDPSEWFGSFSAWLALRVYEIRDISKRVLGRVSVYIFNPVNLDLVVVVFFLIFSSCIWIATVCFGTDLLSSELRWTTDELIWYAVSTLARQSTYLFPGTQIRRKVDFIATTTTTTKHTSNPARDFCEWDTAAAAPESSGMSTWIWANKIYRLTPPMRNRQETRGCVMYYVSEMFTIVLNQSETLRV